VDTNSTDKESFEGAVVPNAAFEIAQYEANEDYVFLAYRLLSWFPVINVHGKTYFPDDIESDVLNTLVGSEVNLFHDPSKIIGVVADAKTTQDGLDVLIRLKRSAVESQNIELNDIVNLLNKCSLELRKVPEQSDYLVLNDDLSVDRTIPSLMGQRSGMKPTSPNDPVPFLYRGQQRVVERVKPSRFTGVGLLNNPADTTALGYGIVASDNIPESPVAPVQEPVGESENKDTHMDLDKALSELKDAQVKLASYETEHASSKSEIDRLKTEFAAAQKELEAAKEEAAGWQKNAKDLQAEKDALKKKEKASAILSDFIAVLPPKDDADKARYEERAAAACDDNGVIREFTLDLREAKLAQAEADAKSGTDVNASPITQTDSAPQNAHLSTTLKTPFVKPKPNETEQASAGDKPAVSIAPAYDGSDANKGGAPDDLWLLA
jgi:hypothetical protein